MRALLRWIVQLFRRKNSEEVVPAMVPVVVAPEAPAPEEESPASEPADRAIGKFLKMPTKEEAEAFFVELEAFSKALREKELPGLLSMSPNSSSWGASGPVGVVLHYTGGPGWRGAVRWFFEGTKASSHFVVSQGLVPGAKELLVDYPLIAALPTTVILCVALNRAAWHASWANRFTFGIENVNLGRLEKVRNGPGWKKPRGTVYGGRQVQQPQDVTMAPGIGYEVYPRAQMVTNVLLIQYLKALHPKLDERLVLPHSAYQRHSGARKIKYDPGPLFPLEPVRSLGFHGGPLWGLGVDIDVNPEAEQEAWATANLEAVQGDSRMLPSDTSRVDEVALSGALSDRGSSDEHRQMGEVRKLLGAMGYFVGEAREGWTGSDQLVSKALWIFHRSMGVTPSGIIRPDTLELLKIRHSELFA